MAPDGLFPAIGMHSLGEEVRLDLQAEWRQEEDDSVMMVDSHEDEWARIYDVRVTGTVKSNCPVCRCRLSFISLPMHCSYVSRLHNKLTSRR